MDLLYGLNWRPYSSEKQKDSRREEHPAVVELGPDARPLQGREHPDPNHREIGLGSAVQAVQQHTDTAAALASHRAGNVRPLRQDFGYVHHTAWIHQTITFVALPNPNGDTKRGDSRW